MLIESSIKANVYEIRFSLDSARFQYFSFVLLLVAYWFTWLERRTIQRIQCEWYRVALATVHGKFALWLFMMYISSLWCSYAKRRFCLHVVEALVRTLTQWRYNVRRDGIKTRRQKKKRICRTNYKKIEYGEGCAYCLRVVTWCVMVAFREVH